MGSLTFQLVCLYLISCVSKGSSDSDALRTLGEKFFQWRMKERPLLATKFNIYKYNDQLEQFSLEHIEQSKTIADKMLAELENVTYSDLTPDDQTSYKILKDMLETYNAGYHFKNYTLNPVNFLEGIHRDPASFIEQIPFNTVGDYENYIARLRQLPRQLRQFDTLMLESVNRNSTLHKVSVVGVLKPMKKLLISDITKSVFFTPVNKLQHTQIPRNQWSDIRRNAYDAVRTVVSAYRQFHTWIKRTYMKLTRKAIGSNKDYYKACLRYYTSLNMTPEEVHQQGLDEVDRIKGNMYEILENEHFNGTIAEYFETLRQNPAFFKTNADEILSEFRSIIQDRINPVLPQMFNDIPKYDVRVIEMKADGPAGGYIRPSPDGSTPGTFLANVLRPEQMPTYTFMALTIHEASPGHHFQITSAMSGDKPRFRRYMENPHSFQVPLAFPFYSAYVEGWALYAESLGEELGLYGSVYELMGRYSSEIFRAARLVVDTGIHYYGWDRETAIEYLQNITAGTRPFLEVEVDRYITWPGQACSYKIGEMVIKNLRKLAEEKLGEHFDIREFHTVVLADGNQPLWLLTETVEKWIADYNKEETTRCPEAAAAADQAAPDLTATKYAATDHDAANQTATSHAATSLAAKNGAPPRSVISYAMCLVVFVNVLHRTHL